jgi:hypothetical protein
MALGHGLTAAWGNNAFLAAQPLKDNADLVHGGMVLPCGAANIADQFFGWYARGWREEFLIHLHSLWGDEKPEIFGCSNRHFGSISADAGQK